MSGPISAIHFEEVRRHVGTDAAHVYGGLLATLTAWAELRGIAYQGVPVGTIKRHATGKGNANKEAMMAAARARGFSPADDNEANAIAILHWALETNGEVCNEAVPQGLRRHRRNPDQVKRDGWQEQGVLAVSVDDDRLTWPERELVRQLGEKLYGPRAARGPGDDRVDDRPGAGSARNSRPTCSAALPGVKPQGYFNAWPEYLHSFADKVGQQPRMRRPSRPARDHAGRGDAALAAMARGGGRPRPLVAGQPDAVESDLLGNGHQPRQRYAQKLVTPDQAAA